LRFFRHEYERHVIDQRCPSGECQGLAVYEVDNATCLGCLLCKKACPSGAIVGERKQAHYILVDKCVGCGSCVIACPKHSIHIVNMETLEGFPNLPAMVHAEQSSAAPHATTEERAGK